MAQMDKAATCIGEEVLLKVKNLAVHFSTFRGLVKAVAVKQLEVGPGELVGLIGETGCGKTVTGLAILRLVPPPGRIVHGKIVFKGIELTALPERVMQRIRGREIAMVFQRPMSSLNPVFNIGDQLVDVIRLHRACSRRKAQQIARDSLAAVGLPNPVGIMCRRPFQLSGGMQQRVMIAMALACEATLLIADEPTTALDVSTQLQILRLIQHVSKEKGMAVLLISHDLSVIGSMCERIYVMYAGNVVESGPTTAVLSRPGHPYTSALLEAVPEMAVGNKKRLRTLEGTVPSLLELPSGCLFAPRCSVAMEECFYSVPTQVFIGPKHFVVCHRAALSKGNEGKAVVNTNK